MRYEAKNGYFKSIAQSIGNFKNIAKTVATRHQRRCCYQLAGDANLFCNDITSFGKGTRYKYLLLIQTCVFSATQCSVESLQYAAAVKTVLPDATEISVYVINYVSEKPLSINLLLQAHMGED